MLMLWSISLGERQTLMFSWRGRNKGWTEERRSPVSPHPPQLYPVHMVVTILQLWVKYKCCLSRTGNKYYLYFTNWFFGLWLCFWKHSGGFICWVDCIVNLAIFDLTLKLQANVEGSLHVVKILSILHRLIESCWWLSSLCRWSCGSPGPKREWRPWWRPWWRPGWRPWERPWGRLNSEPISWDGGSPSWWQAMIICGELLDC